MFSQSSSGRISLELLAFGVGLQAEQPGHRLVEVKDAPGFIHHQHAVFDGVEQGFQEAALARQPLDDGLQAFLVEPADAAEDLVEKTGFGRPASDSEPVASS